MPAPVSAKFTVAPGLALYQAFILANEAVGAKVSKNTVQVAEAVLPALSVAVNVIVLEALGVIAFALVNANVAGIVVKLPLMEVLPQSKSQEAIPDSLSTPDKVNVAVSYPETLEICVLLLEIVTTGSAKSTYTLGVVEADFSLPAASIIFAKIIFVPDVAVTVTGTRTSTSC